MCKCLEKKTILLREQMHSTEKFLGVVSQSHGVSGVFKSLNHVTARSLFLSGLKENLWTLTMQKTTATLREAIKEAVKQEKLLKNKNEFKG